MYVGCRHIDIFELKVVALDTMIHLLVSSNLATLLDIYILVSPFILMKYHKWETAPH